MLRPSIFWFPPTAGKASFQITCPHALVPTNRCTYWLLHLYSQLRSLFRNMLSFLSALKSLSFFKAHFNDLQDKKSVAHLNSYSTSVQTAQVWCCYFFRNVVCLTYSTRLQISGRLNHCFISFFLCIKCSVLVHIIYGRPLI